MTVSPRSTLSPRARQRTRAARLGDVLGAYRLCVELGSGGMATVYLGHACSRSGVHRFAAVKCIRPDLAADERFIQMFLDEAFIATQIQHPNVCRVLELGQHHGRYFLEMELLQGQTITVLQQRLANIPTDKLGVDVRAGVIARVMEGVCEGLHAAHEAVDAAGNPLHVVHRDVSPDNLFVSYDGGVKVMDFGVARTAIQNHRTGTGVIKGKVSYFAPEVISGAKADRRADVWGVGVVLWELLARRKLFDRPTDAAILHAIQSAPILPPSSLCLGLPPQLDAIVTRALARDPARRYHTARELGRDLHRCIVEQRWAVGAAEISDFMRALFPDGIANARQQLQIAQTLPAPAPPRTRSSAPRNEPTVADSKMMGVLARKMGSAKEPRTKLVAVTRVLGLAPSWLIALALVIVCGLAGAVVACRATNEPALPSGFTLEATPAGIDSSGAVLLKIRVVPKS